MPVAIRRDEDNVISLPEVYMVVGFVLAAYSVVANDSIQTLGTFLASNAHRPWWLLWGFASGLMIVVILYGWWAHGGDPAYGRLTKFPEPDGGISWIHAIPPLVLVILTRMGIPVSTTFLVLTVFTIANLQAMMLKSLVGYIVAFGTAIVLYSVIMTVMRKVSASDQSTTTEASFHWVILQWAATAFLWSQWLVQDLANIFVYMPRDLPVGWLVFGVVSLVALQGITFYQFGGRMQHIVTAKTATQDIRAATLIDFSYGIVLLIFKEWNQMPMSTTWVFLGLLAGREIALLLFRAADGDPSTTFRMVFADAGKALAGLAISVLLAVSLPWMAGS